MRACSWMLSLCWLAVAIGGCDAGRLSERSTTDMIRTEDFIGKWRLVRAGGEAPSALNIKSLQIDIAADGTWTSAVEMQGPFAGMTMKGGGSWSLVEGVVSYTSGVYAGKSRVRMESGRLVVDPDFAVLKDGKTEVIGEYEPGS
jgi:hypothetical protein